MRSQQKPQEDTSCWHWLCFKTWYPFASLKSILLLSIILGVIFIILGITLLFVYSGSQAVKLRYSQNGRCVGTGNGTNCQINFEIPGDMKPPITVLYTVNNAYINHRRYLDSMSVDQLSGKAIDKSTAEKQCAPFVYNQDFPVNQSYVGTPLKPQAIAYPCGFKAFLTFNDTFTLYGPDGEQVYIDQRDLDPQYAETFNVAKGAEQEQWLDPENEHFQQWTKTQAMISKHKLWGRIEETLPKGSYSLVVKNQYLIGTMRLKKGVELVSPTKIGGPIHFFTISFIVMGVICIAYAIFLKVKLRDYDDLRQELGLNK